MSATPTPSAQSAEGAYVPPPDWRWDANPSHGSAALLPIYNATRLLPRRVARGIAWVLGTGMAHAFRRTRKVLAGNLRRLQRGGGDERELQRQVTAIIRNWGRCVVDAMYLSHADAAGIRAMIGRLSGRDHLEAALAGGNGAVLITPHLGHWELGGAALALEGYPLNVVSAVVPDASVRNIKHEFRERLGIKHCYIEDGAGSPAAMLGILQALRANEIVAMLPDRDSAAEHAVVEFCGDRARLPTGPAWLAVRTGAALLPAFVVQQPDGRYHAAFEAPIHAPDVSDPRDRHAAVQALTQQMARQFEHVISRYPEQWYNFFPSWVAPDAHEDAA